MATRRLSGRCRAPRASKQGARVVQPTLTHPRWRRSPSERLVFVRQQVSRSNGPAPQVQHARDPRPTSAERILRGGHRGGATHVVAPRPSHPRARTPPGCMAWHECGPICASATRLSRRLMPGFGLAAGISVYGLPRDILLKCASAHSLASAHRPPPPPPLPPHPSHSQHARVDLLDACDAPACAGCLQPP